jgi:hypothetical protein
MQVCFLPPGLQLIDGEPRKKVEKEEKDRGKKNDLKKW